MTIPVPTAAMISDRFFDFSTLNAQDRYKLLLSTIVPGVSELAAAKLDTRTSAHIKPPRIAGSPVAMECELMQIVDLGLETGLVLGRVLAMHVREDVVLDPAKHYIDTPRLKLIGRMHAGWYTRTSSLFQVGGSLASNGRDSD